MNSLSVGFRADIEDRLRSADLRTLLMGNPDPRQLMTYLNVIGARSILEWAQSGCLLEWRTEHLRATPCGFGCALPDFARTCTDSTLSRFALIRREGNEWRLESGRSPWTIELSPENAARIMSGGATSAESALLSAVGMLADTDHEASHWQFHERYFVQRSQLNHAMSPPRRETEPPPLLVRSRFADAPRVTLPSGGLPDATVPSHFAVTEARRTHRSFVPAPVSLLQLSQLLWHTLRVVSLMPREETDHTSYDTLRRPIPSGGGMHAVDTWIYGRNVEGLPEQWWWYDPFAHELVAASSARQSTPPWSTDCPVHIILTAHHERVSWKYGAVAHSLEQKDVGVIMHAIQLASVALGMGAWIIGASDAAGIGTTLGVDIEVDVPLGELVVGIVTG